MAPEATCRPAPCQPPEGPTHQGVRPYSANAESRIRPTGLATYRRSEAAAQPGFGDDGDEPNWESPMAFVSLLVALAAPLNGPGVALSFDDDFVDQWAE